MEFRQLEYFVEIAKEKNITKAAENMYVSQSAMNQYLLKLEKELGTQLFLRGRRTLQLTPAGEIYLRGCKKVLMLQNDIRKEIQDIVDSSASTLRVGLSPTRGLKMFTSIYPRMMEMFPSLSIMPVEMDARTQQKAIAEGTIDLGFIIAPDTLLDSLKYTSLCKEEIILIVPSGFLPAEEKTGHACLPETDIHEAAELPFIITNKTSTFHDVFKQYMKKNDIDVNILIETSNTAHIPEIVKTGMCCGLVPYYYADPDEPLYRCFRLSDRPRWHLYIACRPDAYLTKAADSFIRLAKEFWSGYTLYPE